MGKVHDIVFDSGHPALLARFWAEALDGYQVAPYDEQELSRLRKMGITDPEDDPTVLVEGPAGQPRYFFVRVPEGKTAKNRVHLDLRAEDSAAEVTHLVALGATAVKEYDGWTQMADPEGNEFCILR